MNDDDDLRRRLRDAVADVHPPSRLHEIEAQPRSDARMLPPLLLAAAAVLALVAVGALVASRRDPDPTVTAGRGIPSTTIDVGPVVGEAVAVPERLLPEGFVLVDEQEAIAEPAGVPAPYAVLTFAASPAALDAGGPAIRVAVLRSPTWVDELRNAIESPSVPRPRPEQLLRLDAPYAPLGAEGLLPLDDGPWSHVGRAVSEDVLLLVDGRDVDGRLLDALAPEVQPAV
ncbi:MAG: hypothetical protein R2702_19795 [Acidimicrobiales bacterium]